MSGGSIIQIFREVRAGKQLARARNQKLKQDEIRTWKRLYFELIYSTDPKIQKIKNQKLTPVANT